MTDVTTPSARELTGDEEEARAAQCYELDQRVKAGLRAGREALWDVAAALYAFDELSGWVALGYERIGDWLADPEVTMTRAQFYRLTGMYQELAVLRSVPEKKLKELDSSKVAIVMPGIKSGRVKLDDALDDVQALGARDLRDKYIGRKDPKDEAAPDVGSRHSEDDDGDVVPPQNPIDDTPQVASEVLDALTGEPAQNAVEDSGQDAPRRVGGLWEGHVTVMGGNDEGVHQYEGFMHAPALMAAAFRDLDLNGCYELRIDLEIQK